MTTKITTKYFSLMNALNFVANTTDSNNSIYLAACKSTPTSNDSVVANITQTEYYYNYGIFEEMLFGKKITSSDVKMMVGKVPWTTNTVYDYFDHRTEDLSNTNFYVTATTNNGIEVFKCLWNNDGSPSTVQPAASDTDEQEEYFITADGYKWKYLYSIDSDTLLKFATNSYVPCIPNANVAENAANGAISHFVIEDAGSRYNSYHSGFITDPAVGGNTFIHAIESTASANADFYSSCAFKIVAGTGAGQQGTVVDYIVSGTQKRVLLDTEFDPIPDLTSQYEISPRVSVDGDGTGVKARAVVNTSTNTIYSIDITDPGSGYSWATATVVGNTGIVSGNSVISANTANVVPIISPYGGHGANVYSELYARHVGISASLEYDEDATIPINNDFRTWSIIKNPLFANVTLTLGSIVGTFVANERITQANTNAYANVTSVSVGEIQVNHALGLFETGKTITGATSGATANVTGIEITGVTKSFDTFDQRLRMDITLQGVIPFQEDEYVEESETLAYGYVHEANSTFLALTETKRVWNSSDIDNTYTISGNTSSATADVGTLIQPDLHKYLGDVLYIENVLPISRDSEQRETLKLIVKF